MSRERNLVEGSDVAEILRQFERDRPVNGYRDEFACDACGTVFEIVVGAIPLCTSCKGRQAGRVEK